MQFNSIPFLFLFLPVFLGVYYIVPYSWRNGTLIAGSLLFYWFACGNNLWCLALLCGLTVLTYLAGRLLTRFPKRTLLGLFLGLLIAVLGAFKWYDGGKLLPVGLSFYLFQMMAYLIDSYRRQAFPKNLAAYGARIVMFPKLLSGPLVQPERLDQAAERPGSAAFLQGLHEMILGLSLKVLLANRLGGLWAQAAVSGYGSISTPFAWLALISYALQLYFDFYGYSVMAVGLGHMLMFHLPENFLEPYSAKSVSDFYRCWHATLGAWFRENIYIPLGGNRKGMARTLLNLAIVWCLTGIWHGVGYGYLLWAGFLFLLIANERLWLGKLLQRSRVLCHIYTVPVILLSWVPFAIPNWGSMTQFLGRLFNLGGHVLNNRDYLILGRQYGVMLAVGILFATPLPRMLWNKIRGTIAADILVFVLFWLSVYFIATSRQDPFAYFQY